MVTPYFIRLIARSAPVYLAEHNDVSDPIEKRWPPKLILKWLLLRFITGVSFRFWNGRDTTFDPSRYGVPKVRISPSPSRFTLPAEARSKVILMDSNEQENPDLKEYSSAICEFLSELGRSGIDLCVKGHPRLGHSQCLDRFQAPFLPTGCPIELFDLTDAIAVISIFSHGLAAAAKQGCRAISLLYVVSFHNQKTVEYYREYLDEKAGGLIQYPRSLAEAVEMVRQAGAR